LPLNPTKKEAASLTPKKIAKATRRNKKSA